MRVLGFKPFPFGAVLGLLALLPTGAKGQLRTVISSEVAVSENEASLKLAFEGGGDLTISFQDGQVMVDGEEIGLFARRDGLDLAWRSLLGQVITLDDGPLAKALNDWDPPRDLTGTMGELAQRLDRTLEEALARPEPAADPATQSGTTVSIPGNEGVLGALLSRTGALSGLAEALEGMDFDRFTFKVGEDVVVAAGEVLEGDLILVDGDLEVAGRIDGDVVLTGGTVRLLEDGVITGDLRIAEGSLERSGGSVEGSLQEFDSGARATVDKAQMEALRQELESEIRRDLRSTMGERPRPSHNLFLGVLGNLGSAIAGLLSDLVTFLVLAVLGVMAVHFQRERLEVVATTARRAPMRSAVVGMAGGFFLIPIWIVGVIALAITIIGIPVLLAWIPLFPIAAALAALLGFLAVARNVGEWVAEQEYKGLEWIRGSNTFYTVIAGVGALMVPCLAASASRILGFGFLTGILSFVGTMVTFVAVSVGFGAVLLTRGGKIRPLESYYDFEEDYWADAEPSGNTGPSAPGEEVHPQPAPEGSESGEGAREPMDEGKGDEDGNSQGNDAEAGKEDV